jgi:hypothetical protein
LTELLLKFVKKLKISWVLHTIRHELGLLIKKRVLNLSNKMSGSFFIPAVAVAVAVGVNRRGKGRD